MRFNREFELIIGENDLAVVVRPPLRVSFSCKKSIRGGLNKLSLKIYNLKESNRLKLVKDEEENKRIPLIFSVGYEENLETIFRGTVHKGENARVGNDYVTTLECLDGGYDFIYSFTAKTVTTGSIVVSTILNDMKNTGAGKITTSKNITRPKVLVGNSAKLIEQQLNDGETWFIDDEKLNIIKDGEVVSSFAPVVSSETGMKNTPQRKNQLITAATLMNPSVKIGGLFTVRSKISPHLDGLYKAQSMEYVGDNYGADWGQNIVGVKYNGQ